MAILIFSIYCPLKIFITGSRNVFYFMPIKTMETVRTDGQYRSDSHNTNNQCFMHKVPFFNRGKDTH